MFPFAVKYFLSFDEDLEWELADLSFYRPKNLINVCQCVGFAQHHSRKVLVINRDMACKVDAMAGGLYLFDEELESGEIGVRDGIRKDAGLCKECF